MVLFADGSAETIILLFILLMLLLFVLLVLFNVSLEVDIFDPYIEVSGDDEDMTSATVVQLLLMLLLLRFCI